VEEVRQEEMIFLGMERKPKTEEEKRNDPIAEMKRIQEARRKDREKNMEEFETAKEDHKEEIKENEGPDIKESMLKDRREWIQQQKALYPNKIPEDLKKFYERFNVEPGLTPEEEEAKKLAEEEEAKAKKKKKKDGAKKKKGKKGKGDGDDKVQTVKVGPSEVVQKFDMFYDQYNKDWANRDETDNYEQGYDIEMAKDEVRPSVEEEFKAEVDEMIKMELQCMKILSGAKKKKKKKKKKKAKKKKKKGLKLPGYKAIRDMDPRDILVELINNNIAKKLKPEKITNFIGEFNYLHSMIDDLTKAPTDPSMAIIRQLVTEYIIFPLGSALVKKRSPDLVKGVLFYGPAGTGKTMMVRAIASETNALLFDLSPANIENKYAGKKEEDKLIASVMVVAKEYQPSIIYIDECEKVWPAKKKKKKGQKKKKKGDPTNPARIKKALFKWKSKFLNDETRITLIGCTSEPTSGSKKDFKKNFDKAIYFPFPDYTTRRLMWRTFIEQIGGKLKPDFPLSTLAHISAGYSAGSVRAHQQ